MQESNVVDDIKNAALLAETPKKRRNYYNRMADLLYGRADLTVKKSRGLQAVTLQLEDGTVTRALLFPKVKRTPKKPDDVAQARAAEKRMRKNQKRLADAKSRGDL